MCLADFALNYRVVYGQQAKGKNAKRLLNNMGYIQKRTVGKPAIIRYARFSEKKNPEKFYGSLVKLYVPHRFNEQLKPQNYPTYEDFYKTAFVELAGHRGLNFPVQAIVKAHQQKYEKHSREVDDASEQLQQQGPCENAWTAFAPEIEMDRLDCIAEQEDINPEEENEQDDVPEYQVLRDDGVVPQREAPQMTAEFVRKLFRSLNETQAAMFYTVHQWCQKRVWATKILRQLPRLRDEGDLSMPTVLLTAFTGTAVFNISGKTLHSLLKLPRSLKPPYQVLGNTLDEVRAGLCNLDILIIDEVSRISKDLFAYINWRFQQIKGSKKPFGGISCLAVGDFFQLRDNFQMVTLTELMRQKEDLAFAELLNRLRLKQKTQALKEEDRAFLIQAVKNPEDCPHDALHVFATNKEVHKHNIETVQALHADIIMVDAEDYRKDPKIGLTKKLHKPVIGKRDDLLDTIQVAVGVCVMVTRNLDVEDGIVNGSFGKVGQTEDDVLVYIERAEENMRKGVVRRQFPIKLAYACTAHKVQGMTMQSAVVSLKKIFETEMAYVALSRTTSLSGLHITDFDEKKIYANPEITISLQNMKRGVLFCHMEPGTLRFNDSEASLASYKAICKESCMMLRC
uniref:ATP-dependent DNA helicase n=1 Tax=Xenopus tropicalis TaxID=8364 RepID=A0A803JSB7_XENTR